MPSIRNQTPCSLIAENHTKRYRVNDPPLASRSVILDRPSIFVTSLPQMAPFPNLQRERCKVFTDVCMAARWFFRGDGRSHRSNNSTVFATGRRSRFKGPVTGKHKRTATSACPVAAAVSTAAMTAVTAAAQQ